MQFDIVADATTKRAGGIFDNGKAQFSVLLDWRVAGH